jgi:hypothetical protein
MQLAAAAALRPHPRRQILPNAQGQSASLHAIHEAAARIVGLSTNAFGKQGPTAKLYCFFWL